MSFVEGKINLKTVSQSGISYIFYEEALKPWCLIWDDIPETIQLLLSKICYAVKSHRHCISRSDFFLSLFTFKHNLRGAVLLYMMTVTNLLNMSNLKISTNTYLYADQQSVPKVGNNKAKKTSCR